MTPEERQASIEATATERAATLNPPVHHVTTADLHKRVSELEGKPFAGDPANDFHLKSNALEEQHGKSRAHFVQKLVNNNLIEEASLPLFLKLLNEYEVDDSGEPPYDVAELAAEAAGSGSERWYGEGADWTQTEGAGLTDDTTASQQSFEKAAYEDAGVDVRPSEEKENG